MIDEAEESSSSTDSQRSTSSIQSMILQVMDESAARGELTRENTPNFSRLLTYLEQDEVPECDMHEFGKRNASSEGFSAHRSTSNGHQIHSVVPSSTDVCHNNGSPLLQEQSPVDSGYQPLSNDSCVAVYEDVQIQIKSSHPTCSVPPVYEIRSQAVRPSRQKYPGEYDFSVSFLRPNGITKNMPYTYSEALEKLYIKRDLDFPVKFNCKDPPAGSVVRAMLVYLEEGNVDSPVCRCISHKISDKSPYAAHVVRVKSQPGARYELYNGHNCVVSPFLSPDVGVEPFTVIYKFMCLSSCTGGMNRRSTCIVFSLEDFNGTTLGRDCIQVKICSCPGRDRSKEEKRKHKLSTISDADTPHAKRRNLGSGDVMTRPGYRLLWVRDEHYDVVSTINNALNLSGLLSEQQRLDYYSNETQPTHSARFSGSEEA